MSIQPFSSDSGFNSTGNITTTANIVGVTANNSGYMAWIGNSSGDGNGYTTLQLVPDETLVGTDQYLILDPTSPGHIHIRAGGTQDNSSADLILGGENSHFKVLGGENPPVYVRANSNQWEFGTDGVLTLPAGEGILQSTDDSISLVSFNTGTGNANSVYLGSSGGLGFNDQEIGGNWLEIFRNGAEPEIRVPVGRGNLNIQTAEGVNAYNWVLDNTGNLSLAGSLISNNASPAPIIQNFDFIAGSGNITSLGNEFNITTGLQGNGQGKNLTLAASNGLSNARAGNVTIAGGFGSNGAANGNVILKSAELTWTFDNTGNLTLPGNTFAVNYANGTPVTIGGASIDSITTGANIIPVATNTQFNVTALAESATVDAPTGSPTDGAKLAIRIRDNGSAQTLTWNVIYQEIGTTLPTTTVANKYVYIGCIYNSQASTWDVVSVAQQA